MSTTRVKYRLYPTPAQETKLWHTLEVCRQVYNSFVHGRAYGYEVEGKAPTRFQQEKMLSGWKQSHPELSTVHSHLLQNVAVRVDLAFQAFFRRVKAGETPGYPREKGRGQYDSLTFKEYGNGCKLVKGGVSLSKIGTLKAVVHRHIQGVFKNCTIRIQGDKWYVCFAVEVEPELLPVSEEAVGVDVGLNQFAALSTGEMVANPHFFRKDEKALAKAQRRVIGQKRGSVQRKKARKVVRRIHERISTRRHDFVHQTARRLVNRFGLIAVEKLNVKNMQGNHCLAKSIADASWGMFRSVLASKAESAGRKYAEVNPAWTSQDCSGCGTRIKKKLSERVHYCPTCGLSLDRDTNAALNILRIGQNGMGLHTVNDISL